MKSISPRRSPLSLASAGALVALIAATFSAAAPAGIEPTTPTTPTTPTAMTAGEPSYEIQNSGAGPGIDFELTISSASGLPREALTRGMSDTYVEVLLDYVYGWGPEDVLLPPTAADGKHSRYEGETVDEVGPEKGSTKYKLYTTTTEMNTATPSWNDTIILRNVPSDVDMTLRLYQRDLVGDNDWLGDVVIPANGLRNGPSTLPVVRRKKQGELNVRFGLLGQTQKKGLPTRRDGPIKWRRFHTKTYELLTDGVFDGLTSGEKGYYVYSCDLHKTAEVFGTTRQEAWEDHRFIKKIRDPQGGDRFAKTIRTQHSILNDERSSEHGELFDARGFFQMFQWGPGKFFTYIVRDGRLRFAQSGKTYWLDRLSKHLVHADANLDVLFSGEMFVVPADKIPSNFTIPDDTSNPFLIGPHMSNRPEGSSPLGDKDGMPLVVLDDSSGTFRPRVFFLQFLALLFRINFPGIKVVALKSDDPWLIPLKIAAGLPPDVPNYELPERKTPYYGVASVA